ncbi:MAG: hypothetical protein U0Q10_05370 [Dermatophilaceae bacterium]
MSPLGERLHVLIDQARYGQLTAEATRTGRSVADIVRSAIDLHFDEDRDQAVARLRPGSCWHQRTRIPSRARRGKRCWPSGGRVGPAGSTS